jgi:hypothetical protein
VSPPPCGTLSPRSAGVPELAQGGVSKAPAARHCGFESRPRHRGAFRGPGRQSSQKPPPQGIAGSNPAPGTAERFDADAGRLPPTAPGCGAHSRRLVPVPVAKQRRQQLPDVDVVGLRPPRPAIDLDARSIDHYVLDAFTHQPAVQPESVPPRLVAASHPRPWRQVEALLGLHDRGLEPLQVSAGHRVTAHRATGAEGQFPLPPTQLARGWGLPSRHPPVTPGGLRSGSRADGLVQALDAIHPS